RIRKTLEKLRPPSVTELLLSHDGNQILEGCVTNFFVVCRKYVLKTSQGVMVSFLLLFCSV
ncbi:class IV aminotransferase, partial [Trifolium pratense]